MSKIRRINVSQVEGNDANVNNTNEIRPFGESAIYADESGNTAKPVLSMHDGVRTHLRSKVVGPGVLYGSNADSGDGNGFDTIKLIPDALLHHDNGNYGNNQYIVVDPTSPNHIHIRAGGTQDNSTAELYLGGENSHVKVGSGENPSITIRSDNNDWEFAPFGELRFPDQSIHTGTGIDAVAGSDIELTVNRYPTVSAACTITATDTFTADISEDDDITVVQVGWEINTGTPSAPIWFTVTGTSVVMGETFSIAVTGPYALEFEQGTTYTFRNPTTTASTWTVRSATGTLVTPGGVILANETVDDGGGQVYRDFTIEMLEPGDTYEHRWIFRNDGTLDIPGRLALSGSIDLPGSNRITTGGDMSANSINFSLPDSLNGQEVHEFAFDASVGYPVLRFPDNSLQSTAWTGGRVVPVPLHSYGEEGDRDMNLAFDTNYIYYCTENFTSHQSTVTVSSTDWGGADGSLTTLPFTSERAPQVGWTINITFNSGPATLTITGVVDLTGGRYQVDFNSVGSINVSNGNTGTLVDTLPAADIWKRLAWSGDTW